MSSPAEQKLRRSLRSVLSELPQNQAIPDSDEFQEVLCCLARFLPGVLAEVHREWRFRGIDDIIPIEAIKMGEGEIRIWGLCCDVTDQQLTPLLVQLQNASASDEIVWLECYLGPLAKTGIMKQPYSRMNDLKQRCRGLKDQLQQVRWVHHVSFGKRCDESPATR